MKKFELLNIITESCELSMKEKMVAHYFIYKSNRNGICYPSVETISKACGASERTIQRATRKLQEKGFIIITKRYANGKQTSNEYKINSLLIEEYNRNTEIETKEPEAMEELYTVTSIEEIIQDFKEKNKENPAEEALNIPSAEETSQGNIVYAAVMRKSIPLERYINWNFYYRRRKNIHKIRLNHVEADRFWKGFIAGDLYDNVVDYHKKFKYDAQFERKCIQME